MHQCCHDNRGVELLLQQWDDKIGCVGGKGRDTNYLINKGGYQAVWGEGEGEEEGEGRGRGGEGEGRGGGGKGIE